MWDTIKVFWWGLGPEIQTAVLGATATIVTAVAATVVAIWQIGKQARNAIHANRDNEILKLKLRIYEEMIPISRDASLAEIELSHFVRNFGTQINLFRTFQREGLTPTIPSARASTLMDLQRRQADTVVRLISLTERWRIVDPRIVMLQTAINVAMHDVREASNAYFALAVSIVPHEIPNHPETGKLYPWQLPDEERGRRLTQLQEILLDALMDLGSFIYDFQMEMQNLLLGDLFNRKLSPRKPIDPAAIVLELDRHEELMAIFENKTAWGRVRTQAAANARARHDPA